MRCEQLAPRLIEYLEQELAPNEAQAVTAHLARCERCYRELDSLATTLRLCKQHKLEEPTESFWIDFVPNVRARVEAQIPWWKRLSQLGWSYRLGLASSVLLALGLGYWMQDLAHNMGPGQGTGVVPTAAAESDLMAELIPTLAAGPETAVPPTVLLEELDPQTGAALLETITPEIWSGAKIELMQEVGWEGFGFEQGAIGSLLDQLDEDQLRILNEELAQQRPTG